jgi:hypothetical protein
MKVKITKLTSWKDVLNAARFTQRKELLDKEPSTDFKLKIIKAEHSPLRALMFNIDLYDIPYYTAMHFRTHKLVHLPVVSTSRPDIDGNMKSRNEQKKDEPVNMRLMLDAQEIIAISKVRLCHRAETETRKVWNEVIKELSEIEPELASVCVPSCIYRNMCPEIKCCGYIKTSNYSLEKEKYYNILNNDNNGN